MAKKGKRSRRAQRREQSERDKNNAYWSLGKQVRAVGVRGTTFAGVRRVVPLSDPLGEYREFITKLKASGVGSGDFILIPLNLIDLTASLITSLITGRDFVFHVQPAHDPPNKSASSSNSPTSPSAPRTPHPDEETYNFISRVIKRTQLSCTTFIMGLLFIYRAKRRGRLTSVTPTPKGSPPSSPTRQSTKHSEENSCIPLFLASVICADKYLYDATYSNADWVHFCGGRYSLREINLMERDFLSRVDHNLFTVEEEYLHFLSYLDMMLCLRQQFFRWSSLTYRDLLRLSLRVDPAYLKSLKKTLMPYEAVVLLLKTVLKSVVQYIVALGVALAVAGVAVRKETVLTLPGVEAAMHQVDLGMVAAQMQQCQYHVWGGGKDLVVVDQGSWGKRRPVNASDELSRGCRFAGMNPSCAHFDLGLTPSLVVGG
ncbi:hypothetical protein HK104_000602 [Borealophlyctis nickersoniae]|nr:hypothetical protein HK104_000602 [Borealophlyctis nickersoniae]